MTGLRSIVAALALSCAGAAFAQSPAAGVPHPPAAPAVDTFERQRWVQVRGNAVEIAVGGDGAVFAIDRDGGVWQRPPGDSQTDWIRPFGSQQLQSFRRIDVASENLAWAVDSNGMPYFYNGTVLRPIKGQVRDVGVARVGDRDHVYAVGVDGTLLRYDARHGFVEVEGAPEKLSRVDVDERGRLWVVRENGEAQHLVGKNWQVLPGRISDISAGGGMAYGRGVDGQLLRWQEQGARWVPVAAIVASVAVAGDGKPWIATTDGDIFATEPDTRKSLRRAEAQPQVFTQIVNWKPVRGNARELAIAANGAIFALGLEGELWQWKGKDDWGLLPGKFEHIAVAPNGAPWGISAQGRALVAYVNGRWNLFSGTAIDLAVGANYALWIIQPDGVPARWDLKVKEWKPVGGVKDARRIAVDPAGQPWVVNANGEVWRHDGKAWSEVSGVEAKSLAIGPEGTVFAVGTDNRPWRYDRLGRRWDAMNGEVSAIAVGPRGMPWVTTAKSTILASSFFEEQRPETQTQVATAGTTKSQQQTTTTSSGDVVSAPPPAAGSTAKPTAREPLLIASFQKVPNFTGRDIAIGNEGSVFALSSDGTLARWNNTQSRFLAFPGVFTRIAVAPDGKPWGVTGNNEVWRHDGTLWRAVLNVQAQDIAIGLNGAVIVAAPDESLHRYIATGDRFERIFAAREGDPPPAGSRIAVDPQGRPWTITRDNVLWRCDRQPCERQAQTARDVDIGPEGSVFIVDLDRRLRRFDPATGEWTRIGVDADGVAVGPSGRPWIVTARSEVWSSAYFPRDESRDIVQAASSTTAVATSMTSALPVFTFSISMPFDQIPLPAGFAVWVNPGPPEVHLANGPGGKMVVIDAGLPNATKSFWTYDELLKKLVKDATVPSINAALAGDDIRTFSIGADGTYWVTSLPGINPARVWRRQGSQWVQVPGLDDCAQTPGCPSTSPFSVTTAPDGTVYATSGANILYKYDTAQLKFVKLNLASPSTGSAFVAVDPSGSFWVASPGLTPPTAALYQYVGTSWVKRTDSIIGPPFQCFFSTTPCVSIGATGSAYGFGALGKIVHWNPGLGVWETISSSPIPAPGGQTFSYVAGADGRPWVWTGQVLYRAR